MASPPVIVQLAHADPNVSPITINEQIDLFNTLFSGIIDGDYRPYIISNTEPGPEQRGYIWIEQDTRGAPIAAKIWYPSPTVSAWRRIYNGMFGEIRGYAGLSGPPNWDVSGLGAIGGLYDGWHFCNGKDGTPNLSDKFLIGAHMDDSGGHTGYHNGWQTFVDTKNDLQTGGVKGTMIAETNLPPLDNSAPDPLTGAHQPPGLYIHGKEAKESDAHTEVRALVDIHYANALPHDTLLIQYGSAPNATPPVLQEEYPTLPPFYALAWIVFVGYG